MSNAKVRHRRQRRHRTHERVLEGMARFWANAALWDVGARRGTDFSWKLVGDTLRIRMTVVKTGAIESAVVEGTISV